MPGRDTPPRKKPPSMRKIVAPRAPSGSRIVTPTPQAAPAQRFNLGNAARADAGRFAGSPIGKFLASIPGSARPIAEGASRAFWSLIDKGVNTRDTYDATGRAEKRNDVDLGKHHDMNPHPMVKTRHMRVMKVK